jgi:pimeloyl-ACP methyl ester carboxylesterase
MQSVVLVHGAWHGAWCWYRVVPELVALGCEVHTPDLAGRGSDPRPAAAITLADHVDRVAAAIAAATAPVTLVAHSFGGIVAAQVAEAVPERIARLVYVSAFVPGDGESCISIAPPDPASELFQATSFSTDGSSATLDAARVTPLLYADCPAADVALATRLLCSEPVGPLMAPVRLSAGRSGRVPRHFIECHADRIIPLELQRTLQAKHPCARVAGLTTGHSPFFAAPAALAALIARP